MKSLLQPCKPDILVEIHVTRLPISMPLENFYSAENSGIKHFQTNSVFSKEQRFFPQIERNTFCLNYPEHHAFGIIYVKKE